MTTESTEQSKLLLIFVDETDRCGSEPLYAAVIRALHRHHVAGATALRGIMGFGARRHVHRQGMLGMGSDQPIVILAVDKVSRLETALPDIREMVQSGLITLLDTHNISRIFTPDSEH